MRGLLRLPPSPVTEVCTYVSACVQHNRLRAHMMGLTFKMYCNDNVEDDTCSNCIGRDGIEISLSRALHLCGPPCGSGDWVVGGWGLVDFPVGVGLSSMYSRAGGGSLEQGSMGDELW